MGVVSFAFSVHRFVSSVGADAGLGSVLGLAVLALLHFAQARETTSLREQAEQSAQRVQQLESRLAALSRQSSAPAPTPSPPGARPQPAAAPAAAMASGTGAAAYPRPAPAPAAREGQEPSRVAEQPAREVQQPAPPVTAPVRPAPAPIPAVAAVPAPPAGVAAPALAAATRLIPTAGDHHREAERSVDAGVQEATAIAKPPPATVAGGANGGTQALPVTPAPEVAVASGGPPTEAHPRPAGAAQPRQAFEGQPRPAMAPTAPRRPLLESSGPPPARSRVSRMLAPLLVVLAAIAVVAVLLVLTSSGAKQSRSTPASTTNAPAAHRRRAATTVPPSSVTVSVLNGTATSGLAHRVATRLAADGYKEGAVATAADQTRTSTTISYMQGHRSDALAVASTLKLGPAFVQPVDPSTQAVACPPPSACTAAVIVTAGADLASQ